MILPDVNVLVAVARKDAALHGLVREWLLDTLASGESLGLASTVLSGVVRVCSHPKIFNQPSATIEVVGFCESLLAHPSVRLIVPGPSHWAIFARLCKASGARGNLVTDAYLAALAIERDGEWISFDRDFARFPGLRWRDPLK